MRVVHLASILALSACDSRNELPPSIPDFALDGLVVTINDQRAERCFQVELASAGYRFEVLKSTESDSPGELRWYPPSNDAKEAVNCWVLACLAAQSGGAMPTYCANYPRPPNKSLERDRDG